MQSEMREKERKQVFPEDIDSWEITLDTIGNRITFPTKTMGNILSSVKEIGYWWPRWYQMYEYGTNSHEIHSGKWRSFKSQRNYKIWQLKAKFEGFLSSLDSCIFNISKENEDFINSHFFDSPWYIYLDNIVNVFTKLYNRKSKHFINPKNMSVIIKKIESIYKEIWDKNQHYSYLFTMVLKAKELVGDFSQKYNENSLL